MNGKVLICLEVPSVHQKYDMFVPMDLEISTLIEVLSNSVQDMSNGRYSKSGKETLLSASPRLILNPANILDDYDINDGARLILL